ncbi:hypothetical protein LG201_05055 [Methylobacillus gramineus]|uniref:hypothetical protein n=1 Tax=Methylobacillus gramineus TaxID=755169 RepID=UPI001CFFB597|nr:hypothetical protein [Methylobacillus gramineus]MCB5184567.1 hypothetical protein [Methylobacillus gramineus]
MSLSDSQKIAIFDRIWDEYVKTHGLGGMAKGDFDALLLWEYAKATQQVDAFSLSSTFKIRESRAKSLLDSASIKFDQIEQDAAWSQLLSGLQDVEFLVESLERGQMRFHLKTPLLFRHLQNQARAMDDSFSFNTASEYVIGNLQTLYRILDVSWEEHAYGSNWQGEQLVQEREKIKKIIGKIGQNISSNHLQALKSAKKSSLPGMIEYGSRLSGIGRFIKELVQLVHQAS